MCICMHIEVHNFGILSMASLQVESKKKIILAESE